MRHLRIGFKGWKGGLCLAVIGAMASCIARPGLPKQKFSQASFPVEIRNENDTTFVRINNTLFCPVRIGFADVARLHVSDSLTIQARTDTTVVFLLPDTSMNLHISLGDPRAFIFPNPLAPPFPKEKTYEILQGYNGAYSHNETGNRFALDFNLQVNDTICSADEGYVVGVVKDYRFGGSTPDWQPFSNFITIYHPHSRLYTQYVHLVNQGAFVKVGDAVNRGQAIGLSGVTGYTDAPHLHFNVLKPMAGGQFESVPVEFENGSKGEHLKRGDRVTQLNRKP